MFIHAICCFQIEVFLITVAVPASHQISCFKIQESILERSHSVIYPYLDCSDRKVVKELREIFVLINVPQAVSQLDREGFRELQEDLAGLQVLADFPKEVG